MRLVAPAALIALSIAAPQRMDAATWPTASLPRYCSLPSTLPAECLPGVDAPVKWSPDLVLKLAMAKAEADRRIVPTEEPRGEDQWRYVGSEGGPGDCDDYAMTTRRLLLGMGVPAGAIRMLVVKAAGTGVAHLVLEVVTSKGSWVLDNLAPVPYRLADMAHFPVAVSTADPMRWKSLAQNVWLRTAH